MTIIDNDRNHDWPFKFAVTLGLIGVIDVIVGVNSTPGSPLKGITVGVAIVVLCGIFLAMIRVLFFPGHNPYQD